MDISKIGNIGTYSKIDNIKKQDKSPSFCGNSGVNIPCRLKSPMHSEFSNTGMQMRMRSYLEMKNDGLDTKQMCAKTFDLSKLSDEEKEEKYQYFEKEYVPYIEEHIKKMDEGFKNIMPTQFTRTYYRGLSGSPEKNRGIKVINEAKIGDVIVPDMGYSFASMQKEVAEGYSDRWASGGNGDPKEQAIMKIITPRGSKVSRNYLHLSEVVYQRGAKYEVLDKTTTEDGKTLITLKYLNK